MKSVLTLVVSVLILFAGCSEKSPDGFELPGECRNKCETVNDLTSFFDALVNSSANFSNCLCLGEGELEADVVIGKPIILVGKKDGTSKIKGGKHGIFINADKTLLKDISIENGVGGITVWNSKEVTLSNISISNIAVQESAVRISGSEVNIENMSLSKIKAASLLGGKGLIITGEKSSVFIKNSSFDKIDGTGLLINNEHEVKIDNTLFSNCGFAGIWVQNSKSFQGALNLSNNTFLNNGSVALQILGEYKLEFKDSLISGVGKREINLEVVSDGLVIKNMALSGEEKKVYIEGVEISGYERAGIILDGVEGNELKGIHLSNISVSSNEGKYGLVVQNGLEPETLRGGVINNPFTSDDLSLSDPLYIIETFQE